MNIAVGEYPGGMELARIKIAYSVTSGEFKEAEGK
jgi:hypothetical protein